jgi:hypothetical protein
LGVLVGSLKVPEGRAEMRKNSPVALVCLCPEALSATCGRSVLSGVLVTVARRA